MLREKSRTKASIVLIMFCWLVYTTSYIGKVNYAANINQVMEYFTVDHSTAGLVSTFFFFSYGAGQIINGLLCKKYPLKWMIFASLIVSSMCNIIVGVSIDFDIVKYVWLINGLSMSILWPSLVRLLSENIAKSDMDKASVVMGSTVAIGTLVIYGLSALMVNIDFKLSFYIPAIVFVIVALVWILSYDGIVGRANAESIEEERQTTTTIEPAKQVVFDKRLLVLSIVMLGFFGVATNLIKDGLITWVPSILKEQYALDDSFSIILTLALPIVAIFSNAFAVGLHKKLPDYVIHVALMFLCSAIIIGVVIGGITLNSFVLTLVGFTIVCFLVSSCNSTITAIFPLYMKGKVNSGFIAGMLNGCCYLGSTISSYGLGSIADASGWIAVFWILLYVCVAVCVGAGIYWVVKRLIKINQNMD